MKRSGFGPRKTPMSRGSWSRKDPPLPDTPLRRSRIKSKSVGSTAKTKTRGTHIQELQEAFNAWIRARDAGRPCISCGAYQGECHAGHYRSVGSEPALRFEPDNVHLQCSHCNVFLAGNPIAYRPNLVKKIGLERVEWLEGPHEPKKLTVAEIVEMKAFYRAETRLLKKEAA